MIRLENVSKTFQKDGQAVEAVHGVSLSVSDGEIYGIIGYSGAGKSTLVRLINLLEKPTEGKVFIGETELTALSPRALRRERARVGMIFQQFNLFATRTALENVMFPMRYHGLSRETMRQKALELLSLVDLSDKAGAYPSQLSGGQKQRVAIARALASEPEILLCDEATSALDPQTTEQILQLLRKLNRELKLTIVIITHEMAVVKGVCDRVAVMEKGRVVEEGRVVYIFSAPQESVTREFIDAAGNVSSIYRLIDEKAPITRLSPGQCILRLKYLDRSAGQSLVSHVSRAYNVDLNIIFGNIDLIGEDTVGGLVVIASGAPGDIEQSITYLKEKNVEVEVILRADAA